MVGTHKNTGKIKLVIIIIAAFLMLFSILQFKDINFDYWVWLGCPYPMILLDNYPGHDYTAVYRHENYFIKLPNLNFQYKELISHYGEPIQIEEQRYNEGYLLKAVYRDFFVNFYKPEAYDLGDRRIYSIVITSDGMSFTRDRIKVGDKREKITHCYRYYSKIESALHEGYIDGYIDGSMLTGQTWIEFAYDDSDCVKYIMLYDPY